MLHADMLTKLAKMENFKQFFVILMEKTFLGNITVIAISEHIINQSGANTFKLIKFFTPSNSFHFGRKWDWRNPIMKIKCRNMGWINNRQLVAYPKNDGHYRIEFVDMLEWEKGIKIEVVN